MVSVVNTRVVDVVVVVDSALVVIVLCDVSKEQTFSDKCSHGWSNLDYSSGW
jgi:hypothetical protein